MSAIGLVSERFAWTGQAADEQTLTSRDFAVEYADRMVPGAMWLPRHESPKALVLIGHGGSQHRRHESVLSQARPLVERFGFAVVSIDGPVHGLRRPFGDTATPKEIQREFLGLWEVDDGGTRQMAEDWRAVIAAILSRPEVGQIPLGYSGISMGTAYGLPLLASEPRVRAAAIGMWGLNYPKSERLAVAARNVGCASLFIHRRDDELFTFEGAMQLFDLLGSDDKRMLILPGRHVETAEQFESSVRFLGERLSH